ncbi:MAG TPA: membrane protein insertase YidC [Legionellales bacterium]|nr:membrane protein insertase YidC [Legionellales bacterium]
MDMKNLFLYGALAIVSFSLWTDWKSSHPPTIAPQSIEQTMPQKNIIEHDIQKAGMIKVKTDVLNLSISLDKGQVIDANLLKFPQTFEDNKPFTLFTAQDNHEYYASSSFVVMKDGSPIDIPVQYSSEKSEYQLDANQNELKVVLTGHSQSGVEISKTYTFKPGSYVIDIDYALSNQSSDTLKTYLNQQISWKNPSVPESSMFQIGSFTGASFGQPGKHRYKKVAFDQIKKQNLDVDANGGWVAMQQHYFLTAWVPTQNGMNRLYSQYHDNHYIIGSVSEAYTVQAFQTREIKSQLYVGPEDTAVLKTLAPGLDLTVDYGWLWFLSDAIFKLMKTLESFLGNWGWSIVCITVFIKLCFYRLSASSYRSMANMRRLQPKLEQLKHRFGDDKAKFSQATMELYRQEKVNPLGGCLPILVQIPVFIALYWVLVESVELRHAPFIFWIKDLSAPDPLHILPLLMGLTMFIQQKLNPTPPDPMQAKAMMFMPIFFTILFWAFPAGLVLYWIVNNTLSIIQQWWITRQYSETPVKA